MHIQAPTVAPAGRAPLSPTPLIGGVHRGRAWQSQRSRRTGDTEPFRLVGCTRTTPSRRPHRHRLKSAAPSRLPASSDARTRPLAGDHTDADSNRLHRRGCRPADSTMPRSTAAWTDLTWSHCLYASAQGATRLAAAYRSRSAKMDKPMRSSETRRLGQILCWSTSFVIHREWGCVKEEGGGEDGWRQCCPALKGEGWGQGGTWRKAWEHRTNGPKKKKPDFSLSLNG
jgi:hypothetical protein